LDNRKWAALTLETLKVTGGGRTHTTERLAEPGSTRRSVQLGEGGCVDDEPVADVGGQDAFVGLVDLVGVDDFDI
jgi:hypothetical protein